jgi:hypothetical protein
MFDLIPRALLDGLSCITVTSSRNWACHNCVILEEQVRVDGPLQVIPGVPPAKLCAALQLAASPETTAVQNHVSFVEIFPAGLYFSLIRLLSLKIGISLMAIRAIVESLSI